MTKVKTIKTPHIPKFKKKESAYRPETKKIEKEAKIYMSQAFYDALFSLAERNLEWTLYGKVHNISGNEFRIDEFIVPNQKNSPSESEVTAMDMAEWQQRKYVETKNADDICGPEWSAWIHSHHKMSAFWSGTDRENMELLMAEKKDSGQPVVCIVVSTNQNKKNYQATILYPSLNLEVEANLYIYKDENAPPKAKEIAKDIKTEQSFDEHKEALKNSILYYNNEAGQGLYEKLDKELDKREIKHTYSNCYYSRKNKYGHPYRPPSKTQSQLGFTSDWDAEDWERDYWERTKKEKKNASEEDLNENYETSFFCNIAFANENDLAFQDDKIRRTYAEDRGIKNRQICEETSDISYPEAGYYICDDEYNILVGKTKDGDNEIKYLKLLDIEDNNNEALNDLYDKTVSIKKCKIVYFDETLNPLWEMVPKDRKNSFKITNPEAFYYYPLFYNLKT